MKNSAKLYLLFLFAFGSSSIFAQEFNLNPEKPGSFKITYWKLLSKNFSATEINAYLQNLSVIPEIMRKNPVFANTLGFDCDVDLHSQDGIREYGHEKIIKVGYGIPCEINFHFCFFYYNQKGNPVRFSIEPPHWDILINRLAPFTTGGPLTRNGDLFFVSTNKETVSPGIDRYDNENIFIYNPDNPPYFIPVTIKEVFTEMINYYKNDPDKIAAEYSIKMLEDEYALFSAGERNDNAYQGGRGQAPLSNINNEPSSLQVMRVNPKYWNKNLPRSAIQTIAFKCNKDKNVYERELATELKSGSVYYHINRMLAELNIESLRPVIR